MTRSTFLLQFLLNTRLATLDKFPIRLGDLLVMDIDGTALPETVVWSAQPDCRLQELVCLGMGSDRFYHRPIFQNNWVSRQDHWRCVLAIDPAGRGHDELAYSVVAELNGNMYVLEVGGTQLGYADEVLEVLAKCAKRWEVNYVVVESNFGGGMFTELLKPHMMRVGHPVTIEEVQHSQRKEVRLCDTLGPVIQQHRLVFTSRVIKFDYRLTEDDPETGYQRSIAYQMSRLTPERGCLPFDDRIDALAIAVAFFTDSAAQDQQKSAQHRADQLQQEAYAAWMDETGSCVDALALGWRPQPANGAQGGTKRLVVGRV